MAFFFIETITDHDIAALQSMELRATSFIIERWICLGQDLSFWWWYLRWWSHKGRTCLEELETSTSAASLQTKTGRALLLSHELDMSKSCGSFHFNIWQEAEFNSRERKYPERVESLSKGRWIHQSLQATLGHAVKCLQSHAVCRISCMFCTQSISSPTKNIISTVRIKFYYST